MSVELVGYCFAAILMICGPDGREAATMTEQPSQNVRNEDSDIPRLGLRPKEAARALGIGTRLLWEKTNCNEIPHVRIGKAIVYPVDSLREYLARKAKGGRQ
jgi:predicted DNA-binding transcriptional regulator AlpA